MIARMTGPRSRREAPALRFLLLCLGGWVVVRAVMNGSAVVPVPPEAASLPWRSPPPMVPASAALAPLAVFPPVTARQPASVAPRQRIALAPVVRSIAKAPPVTGREDVAAGFAFPVVMPMPEKAEAAASARASPADPLISVPMRASLAGWSLGGWLYLRGEAGRAADTLAAGGQIGGSQAGARLAYGFGESGRTHAYGRATVAVRRWRQRELALGLAHAPVAGLPVDVAVERRIAIGREGRDAFAAMAVSGVSDVALPAGFRLDAYAQAGIVGARRRDGFADGALVVDRPLGSGALRLGALAAGAVQPGATRADVGPRLTLRLRRVGKGARLALDWRQRVAGDARPESGPALTLGADF